MAYKLIKSKKISDANLSSKILANKNKNDENFVFEGLEEKLNEYLKQKKEDETIFALQIIGYDRDKVNIIEIQIVKFDDTGMIVNFYGLDEEFFKILMSEIKKRMPGSIDDGLSYSNDFGTDTMTAAKNISDIFIEVFEVFEIKYEYQYQSLNDNPSSAGCMVIFILLSSSFFTMLFLILK